MAQPRLYPTDMEEPGRPRMLSQDTQDSIDFHIAMAESVEDNPGRSSSIDRAIARMESRRFEDSIDRAIGMAERASMREAERESMRAAERESMRAGEHEAALDRLEQEQLEDALAESQKLQYMSAEERMAAGEKQEAESEAREPPLERPEDLDKWKRWADAYADLHTRYTHPRAYDDTDKPTHRQLSLFTSAREIGRQFGAGVQLYLDLMAFYLTACVLGGALYAYVAYLNVHSQGKGVWQTDGPLAFFESIPLLLVLTTSGARIDCTDLRCRRANTCTATVDVLITVFLLVRLPRRLRTYVGRVGHKIDHARVTTADYTVELTGLPNKTVLELTHHIQQRLQRHAQARLKSLESREKKLRGRVRTTGHALGLSRSLTSATPGTLARIATPRRLALEAANAQLQLLETAVLQARRFVDEERWRVADGGVVLCMRNGALLTRAQTRVPLLTSIERLKKIDQRTRAVRGDALHGPPTFWRLWTRLGDWSRARRIAALERKLTAVSSVLLNRAGKGRAAHSVARSAFVTFEWEEGRLEALHAFQRGWWQAVCCGKDAVAHEAAEPSDVYHHVLEHRRSWGNVLRRCVALSALLLVLGGAFSLLFATANVNDILLANTTSSLCNGLRVALDEVRATTTTDDDGSGDGDGGSGSGAAADEGGDDTTGEQLCLYVSDLAARLLPVLVAPTINNVLYLVVDKLARLQRPASFTTLTYTKAAYIFLFQLLNIGGITLLIAATSRARQDREGNGGGASEAGSGGDGDGDDEGGGGSSYGTRWWEVLSATADDAAPYDYSLDYEWYEITSSSVLLMVLTLALSSGGWPILQGWLTRRRRLYLQPRAVTAHALRGAVTGPHFLFAQRLGASTCVVTLVLVFGAAMPLVFALGAFYFGVAIVTQRWALLRVHRLPEHDFDDRVLTRMVKWTKYVLLAHLLATYATMRTLPGLTIGELSEMSEQQLGSVWWLKPLIAEQGPWLSPSAFDQDTAPAPSAPPAPPPAGNATDAADAASEGAVVDPDALSVASLLTLVAAFVALAAVLVVCTCSSLVNSCNALCSRRRREALTARVSRDADAASARARQQQLQLRTEIGLLQGLPPLSATLHGGGVEHAALRRLPNGTFVHLNEVDFDGGERRCCGLGGGGGVPWPKWASASRAAAHTSGLKSYRPIDHPLYHDACALLFYNAVEPPRDAAAAGGNRHDRGSVDLGVAINVSDRQQPTAGGGGGGGGRPHARSVADQQAAHERLTAAGFAPREPRLSVGDRGVPSSPVQQRRFSASV